MSTGFGQSVYTPKLKAEPAAQPTQMGQPQVSTAQAQAQAAPVPPPTPPPSPPPPQPTTLPNESRKDAAWRRFGEALATHGISLDDLIGAGEQSLGQALDDLHFGGLDKALILARLRPMTLRPGQTHAADENSLAQHFKAEREADAFPWLARMQRAETVRAEFAKTFSTNETAAFAALEKAYRDAAKAGLLTVIESVVLQYLLFATDEHFARYQLCCLLLRVLPEDRLAQHNWDVASRLERGHLLQIGATIDKLQQPLFPYVDGLESFNVRLLQAAREGGGQPATARVFSVRPTMGTSVDAAGTLPVVNTQDGWGIDTTQIESAFGEVFGALNALNDELKTIKEANKCGDKLRHAKTLLGTTRQQVRQAAGRGRGRGGGSRGRGSRSWGRPTAGDVLDF